LCFAAKESKQERFLLACTAANLTEMTATNISQRALPARGLDWLVQPPPTHPGLAPASGKMHAMHAGALEPAATTITHLKRQYLQQVKSCIKASATQLANCIS
jgi:hypothetical protein